MNSLAEAMSAFVHPHTHRRRKKERGEHDEGRFNYKLIDLEGLKRTYLALLDTWDFRDLCVEEGNLWRSTSVSQNGLQRRWKWWDNGKRRGKRTPGAKIIGILPSSPRTAPSPGVALARLAPDGPLSHWNRQSIVRIGRKNCACSKISDKRTINNYWNFYIQSWLVSSNCLGCGDQAVSPSWLAKLGIVLMATRGKKKLTRGKILADFLAPHK